ncbi:nucleoside phosphorylase [Fluviispira multicolorata]|uniref:Uridine phosphorylase n=1 Tax=Fluviispira multicolorata TaxID=2654512 RepID=A0A833N5U9_9BACT|nr:nucleoside phosphorylase [Fluviispira multicolorata]KAB8033789.1 uridine phosphorylase [Fluviispira multicolorata]
MKLNHLNFEMDFLSTRNVKLCLLSGDPSRTKLIAEKYLNDAKLVCDNRGLLCYVGQTSLGLPILAATSGMGAPSTSIVVSELAQAGINVLIRVGTTGSIQKQIEPGSLIINYASLCKQGAALDIAPNEFPSVACPLLSTDLYYTANAIHPTVYFGINASVDTFYEGQERYANANPHLLRKQQGLIQEYQNLNILNFEMETGTLFKMASVYKLHATSICGVVAARYSEDEVGEKIIHEVVELTIDSCIKSALKTLENIQCGKLKLNN